jgi:hypothetical protein
VHAILVCEGLGTLGQPNRVWHLTLRFVLIPFSFVAKTTTHTHSKEKSMKAHLGVSAAALVLALTSTLAVAEEGQTQDRSLLFGRTKTSGASGSSPDDGSKFSMRRAVGGLVWGREV